MPWLRRSLVVTVALIAALPVALLAVATAWLGSNLNDIAPRPRPAALLLLPEAALPDNRNAFFALVGLSAEAGRDAWAAGHALWQVNLARAAMSQQERLTTTRYAELNQQEAEATGQGLPEVTGRPMLCTAAADGCVAEWLAQPVALAAQRQQMAALGERCDALLARGLEFEERLPAPVHYAANMAPHIRGAGQCSRWWRSGAVLAWQQGQPQQAVALLARATRMNTLLLAGSRSLISTMVTASITRDTQATVVGLALRDPWLAQQLARLLAPLPDTLQVAAMRRAVAVESAVNFTAIAELAECLDPVDVGKELPLDWVGRQFQRLQQRQCRHRVGFHPERIHQLFDDFWLGVATALDGGLPAAITHLERNQTRAEERGWQWQNSIGQILVDVAAPGYVNYFRQAADLPLHTEAAALALAAAGQQVPAPERAAWARHQPLSPALRERLRWDAAGQGFTVRTWYEDGRSRPVEPRKAIRFEWPATPQG